MACGPNTVQSLYEIKLFWYRPRIYDGAPATTTTNESVAQVVKPCSRMILGFAYRRTPASAAEGDHTSLICSHSHTGRLQHCKRRVNVSAAAAAVQWAD